MIRQLKRRRERRRNIWTGYSSEPQMLREYTILIGTLNLVILASIAATARNRREEPDQMSGMDFLVLALAVHKLARIITMDKVTRPLRAPFTQFVDNAGAGEVVEVERGEGLRRAMGDLMTCPFCATPWAASLMVLGHAVCPRATRIYGRIFALTTVGHFLNHAYVRAKGG